MKPRTKIEVAVHDAAKYLTKLSQKQIDFACDQFFSKLCYRSKHKAFCLECGESIPVGNISRNRVTCECCGSKLKVEATRKRSLATPIGEFALADTFNYDGYEFQIIRMFYISVKYFRGTNKEIFCEEVTQRWSHNKKTVIHSKLINSWSGGYRGILEIRKTNRYKKYDIYPSFYLKESVFLEKYTKKGINAKNLGYLDFEIIATTIEHNPKSETLLKAGYYSVLGHFNFNDIERYWGSLKICIRNNYKIKDPTLYIDYLDSLAYLGKDVNNAFYVCPKNLKKEHDFYLNLKKIEMAKRKLKIAEKEKLSFTKRMSKFKEIKFQEKEILIQPLKTIKDFQKEGEILNHCIFENKYYEKKDHLFFSASVSGQKTETIQVSLVNFDIVQCRGLSNQNSEYHDKIVALMKSNLNKIQKIQLSN